MWLIEVIIMLFVFFIGAAFGIITEDRTLKKWFDERLNEFYSQIEGNVGNDDERVNNLYKEAEEISNNAGDTKEED